MKTSTPSHCRIAAAISAAFLTHFAAPAAFATTYYWDNNGDTAGFGSATGSWAAPTTGGATQGWSTSSAGTVVPGDVTTTTSDTVNFGTATAGLATGTINVSGTVNVNKVNYGSASGAITLSGGTIALGGTAPAITASKAGQIIGSALTLNANTSMVAGISGNPVLSLNGVIDGSGGLTFTTASSNFSGVATSVSLGASSSYTGTTTITLPNTTAAHNNNLTVKAAINDALPTTTVLTLDGYAGAGSGRTVAYDLAGNDQTLAGLTNVARTLRFQRILNGGGAATLTIDNTSNYTFSGNINGTNLGLKKTGAGTQTLGAANAYTGSTTIDGGKLLGVVGGNCANSAVILNNASATYGVSITDNTKSWTCAALTAAAAGTLEFNFGTVAPSNSVSPLTITGLADFASGAPAVNVIVSSALTPGTYPLAIWGSVSGTAPGTGDLTVSQVLPGTTPSLSVSDNTLNLVINSTAAATAKANNTTNLNLGSSWVGGVVPTSGDQAKWNSTVTSANTTVLGADLTWAGIAVEDPAGLVTIGGGNTLTLGAAAFDIDLSVATADLTLNCALVLGDTNIWDVAASRTLTLGGGVSGSFPMTKQGDGTAILSGANTYSGNTTVSAGTLRLGASDVIPNGGGTGNVSVDGTLDLNGNSETINGLSGSGIVDSVGGGTPTLTVGDNNQSSTFSGVIQNTAGTLNLVKTGSGAVVLGGANTLGGSVTVEGGTLAFASTAPFDTISGIAMADGTTLRPDVVNAVISAPITVDTTATINAPSVAGAGGTSAVPFTLGGAISGTANVTFSGIEAANAYGNIILKGASDYQGTTLITCTGSTNTQIFVRLGIADALPTTTVLTLDGGNGAGGGRFCDLNLNGHDQTLAGLTNVTGRTLRSQRVNNTSATPATLTINGSDSSTFSGQLGGGGSNFGLTKSGSGVFTVTGTRSYAGDTTVTAGILSLGGGNANNDLSTVTIASGAKLELTYAGTDTVAALIINGAPQAGGVYGHTDSGANNGGQGSGFFDAYFAAGTGTLTLPEGFASWITGTFANGTVPPDQQGENDDYDNDGISNLAEYAIAGQDPTVSNPAISSFSANTLSFNKRAGTSGLTYAIQESTDLGVTDDWTEVAGASYTNNPTTISYTLTPGTPVRNFIRLQVLSN